MRTNRPVPVTGRVWMPPVPVVVEKMVVQLVLSGDVCIWNAEANAVSQLSTTWLIVSLAPRSIWSHCGSENVLDQRVVVLPSTALAAGVPAFSAEDAVAGLPCDSRVLLPPPVPVDAVPNTWNSQSE